MEKLIHPSNSPVGVLEDYLRSFESDTISYKGISSEENYGHRNARISSHWCRLLELFTNKSKKDLAGLVPDDNLCKLSRWRSKSLREKVSGLTEICYFSNARLPSLESPCRNFSLYELQLATQRFSHDNLVGKGGYAEVFKGCLQDGMVIAVKRLVRGTPDDRVADFLTELGIMAHVNHPNIVKLFGYGVEGGMHIVLEYSHLGSLASVLHGSDETELRWSSRHKIALGIAEGLMYLHYGCQRRIVHRDIKAANILLTENFDPQICDFGLAKWLPEKWTHHTVAKIEGTFGYLSPEYLTHGIVDEKTDVFAFGVLLLELITGRRALDCTNQSLVMWAKPLLRRNSIRELIDPALGNSFNWMELKVMLLAASLCIQHSSIRRPHMNQVLQLLRGNLSSLESLENNKKPSFWNLNSEQMISTNVYSKQYYL